MEVAGFSFDGILRALEKDKLGALAGALLTEYQISKDWKQDFLGVIENQASALLSKPHIPKLEDILMEIRYGTPAAIFKPSVTAAIIGWLLEEAKIHPQVTKYAGMAKNIGKNFAIGSVAVAALLHASVLNSPVSSSGATGFSSGRNPRSGVGSGQNVIERL